MKIDRQFVTGLPDCRESVALVRGILVIAEQLDMQVVAEGVENQRQADFLRRNGCHRLQGFLFGRPQSAAACIRNSEASCSASHVNA
ncbi:Cyclic di-GMP phosphodiesterase Gmr [compost metagenome]